MTVLKRVQDALKELGVAEVVLRHHAKENKGDDLFFNKSEGRLFRRSSYFEDMAEMLKSNPQLESDLLAIFTAVNEKDNDDRPEISDATRYVINSLDVASGKITDGVTSLAGHSYSFDGNSFVNTTGYVAALKEAGVSEVLIDYSGNGDSGNGFHPKLTDSEGNEVPSNDELGGIAEDLGYAVLEEFSPGWEINEGSEGRITLDVNTGELEMDHHVNLCDTEKESFETNLSNQEGLSDSTKKQLEAMTLSLDGQPVVLEFSTESRDLIVEHASIDDGSFNNPLSEEMTQVLINVLQASMDDLRDGWGWSSDDVNFGTMKLNMETGDVAIDLYLNDYSSENEVYSAIVSAAVVYDPSVDGDLDVEGDGKNVMPRPSM